MAANFLIYVIEDNEWYNKLLVHSIALDPEFEVRSFVNAKEALEAIEKDQPNAVSMDYTLPDMSGEELLSKIKSINENIEVVVISEQDNIETALNLLRSGAYDYHTKSTEIKDRILNTMRHIRDRSSLQKTVDRLQQQVEVKFSAKNTLIGNSPGIVKVFSTIEKALSNTINVMINGETGTGKEMVAKAIHFNSLRKSKPFIAINVGAIPSELIESELFGHEKGSFTGAGTQRIGKFEEASGGTLFLDEIAEMDPNAQVKLLRVLQEKEITRVGGNKTIKVDCRIIVATHRNLLEEVQKGNFREDLYYRLIGLPIILPPLRERKEDILLLAKHFVNVFCAENGMQNKSIGEDAQIKLKNYQWPGNVRELKSIIDLACVLADGPIIQAADISLNSSAELLPDLLAEDLSMREYNIRIVQALMDRYNNDTKRVAEKLDIGQTTVYRLLKEAKGETY